MSVAPWTVARYVVETIAANGIDTVFGIPGVHNLELYRGLEFSRVRHVLARHEQNAGFAADGYARVSARPAAAFVISGPGVTNILTAVAQANSDSVPILVIASSPVRASLGQRWGVLHELVDQCGLAAHVTGYAASARTPEEVREQLRAAFATLRAPRARPAYMDIPLDLLAETTTLQPERFAAVSPARAPDEADACAGAAAARRGASTTHHRRRQVPQAPVPRCRQLLEALDGYLVTTVAAKGVLAETHPANLGASLPYRPTQAMIAAADVVIAAGTELSETDVYTTTRLPLGGHLVRIDVDAQKLSDQFGAAVRIHADATLTLERLASGVRPRAGWRTASGPAGAFHARIAQEFDSHSHGRLAALRALRASLPSDGVVFSDMTQIAYLGNYAFPAERPGLWFHPSGYGALGFALPAAIGAKLAQPTRSVVALAGDFGWQFTHQELMTAVELDLTLPIVVWNNEALGQIRDDMQAAGIAPIGVVGRNPDFTALASACGAAAVRIRDPHALQRELRQALLRPGPTLIEAIAADFGLR